MVRNAAGERNEGPGDKDAKGTSCLKAEEVRATFPRKDPTLLPQRAGRKRKQEERVRGSSVIAGTGRDADGGAAQEHVINRTADQGPHFPKAFVYGCL